MSANPGGGDYVREGDAAGADNQGTELDRLRRWKAEALEVITGLQELGKVLGVPLGKRITGPAAIEAAEALQAENARLRQQIAARDALRHQLDTRPPSEHIDDTDICERCGRRHASTACPEPMRNADGQPCTCRECLG